MAKKARQASAGRRRKKSKARKAKARKAKGKLAKTKAAGRKKGSRKAKPHTLGNRLADAFHTMVDTVKDTSALRDKLEPPGTSGSE